MQNTLGICVHGSPWPQPGPARMRRVPSYGLEELLRSRGRLSGQVWYRQEWWGRWGHGARSRGTTIRRESVVMNAWCR